MSKTTGTSSLLIAAAVLVILFGLGYFLLAGSPQQEKAKTSDVVAEKSASAEKTETETAVPAATLTPETQGAVNPVIETKTLNLPAAKVDIPASESSNDPVVEDMMGIRALGSDDAPIKVVEYSSLTCSHCATFHKMDLDTIKAEYIDTGKVQFIFKEFPLNKPAIDASKLLRCLPKERFNSFMSLLFAEQEKWAFVEDYLAPLKQNAKLAGLSEEQVEACLDNKTLESRIIGDMKAASEKYKVGATPTFVINDGAKVISGHQPVQFFRDTFNALLGIKVPEAAAPTATPEEKQ
ncbi:MAG: thioredoxin domain-containing protein [Pseudobdellovibrionaceae bacterium]